MDELEVQKTADSTWQFNNEITKNMYWECQKKEIIISDQQIKFNTNCKAFKNKFSLSKTSILIILNKKT